MGGNDLSHNKPPCVNNLNVHHAVIISLRERLHHGHLMHAIAACFGRTCLCSPRTQSRRRTRCSSARAATTRARRPTRRSRHIPRPTPPRRAPNPHPDVTPVEPLPWPSQCRIRLCANDARIGCGVITTRRGLGCPECSALSVACRAWNALSYRHSSHHCSARVLSAPLPAILWI